MTPAEIAECFYRIRDRRTRQYDDGVAVFDAGIIVSIGAQIAEKLPGQAAALTLINLLTRVHRHLVVQVPDAPLTTSTVFGGSTLASAIEATALAITPVIDLTVTITDAAEPGIRVNIRTDAGAESTIQLGWCGGLGEVVTTADATATGDDDSLVGALTAACLAATAIFRIAGGHDVPSTRLNLVEGTEGVRAGNETVKGPISLGDVLVVGAGAVSQAMLFFAQYLHVEGQWEIADGDYAELHNANRCMLMSASDGGWNPPLADDSGTRAPKALIGARAINATAHIQWYDELDEPTELPDLILPLANERGVRAVIASRGEPILLHATTSADWTSELHRHIAGVDDCPSCRLDRDRASPTFVCSTAPTNPGQPDSRDAALPFLSAMAGLMLAVELAQLSHRQSKRVSGSANHWRLHLRLGFRLWQVSTWPNRCPHGAPSSVVSTRRAQIPAWARELRQPDSGNRNGLLAQPRGLADQ